ncbi:MAG: hypothetical protein IPI84_04440 [Holophagaceae bacterium]|nr:hypothetical protein [Holophagaceae bacterium]
MRPLLLALCLLLPLSLTPLPLAAPGGGGIPGRDLALTSSGDEQWILQSWRDAWWGLPGPQGGEPHPRRPLDRPGCWTPAPSGI